MVESTRDLNRLYLVGKPMLILNTLLSFASTAVAVAILMRIFALLWSPFMVTLALMLFLLFSMILDLSVLTTMLYALALATTGFDRYCSSLL